MFHSLYLTHRFFETFLSPNAVEHCHQCTQRHRRSGIPNWPECIVRGEAGTVTTVEWSSLLVPLKTQWKPRNKLSITVQYMQTHYTLYLCSLLIQETRSVSGLSSYSKLSVYVFFSYSKFSVYVLSVCRKLRSMCRMLEGTSDNI